MLQQLHYYFLGVFEAYAAIATVYFLGIFGAHAAVATFLILWYIGGIAATIAIIGVVDHDVGNCLKRCSRLHLSHCSSVAPWPFLDAIWGISKVSIQDIVYSFLYIVCIVYFIAYSLKYILHRGVLVADQGSSASGRRD